MIFPSELMKFMPLTTLLTNVLSTTDADTSSLGVHLSVDIIEEIEMCCLEKIFD